MTYKNETREKEATKWMQKINRFKICIKKIDTHTNKIIILDKNIYNKLFKEVMIKKKDL